MATKIEHIKSTMIPLEGNDIDTDRIIPARFLKCVTFDGLGEHAFLDDRIGLREKGQVHSFDDEAFKGGGILVVNKNFGCGSSREHAPQSLLRFGIQAIIGESFAEIFFGNCVALGVPCFTMEELMVQRLQQEARQHPKAVVSIDVATGEIKTPAAVYQAQMKPSVKEQFVSGNWDVTGLLLDNLDKVKQTAAGLPYFSWGRA